MACPLKHKDDAVQLSRACRRSSEKPHGDLEASWVQRERQWIQGLNVMPTSSVTLANELSQKTSNVLGATNTGHGTGILKRRTSLVGVTESPVKEHSTSPEATSSPAHQGIALSTN